MEFVVKLNSARKRIPAHMAAAPIHGEDGYTLGIAEKDRAGYIPTARTFATYQDAVQAAREWNRRNGVTEEEAAQIILSSMREGNLDRR